MSQLIRFASLSELPAPGELRAFAVQGREICIANDGGTFAALDNHCPHRKGPLNEGEIDGGKLVCPWHGWEFRLSDGACPKHSQAVQTYPLTIRGEDVLLEI